MNVPMKEPMTVYGDSHQVVHPRTGHRFDLDAKFGTVLSRVKESGETRLATECPIPEEIAMAHERMYVEKLRQMAKEQGVHVHHCDSPLIRRITVLHGLILAAAKMEAEQIQRESEDIHDQGLREQFIDRAATQGRPNESGWRLPVPRVFKTVQRFVKHGLKDEARRVLEDWTEALGKEQISLGDLLESHEALNVEQSQLLFEHARERGIRHLLVGTAHANDMEAAGLPVTRVELYKEEASRDAHWRISIHKKMKPALEKFRAAWSA